MFPRLALEISSNGFDADVSEFGNWYQLVNVL